MANNLINVKVVKTITHNGKVVVPNDELTVDAKTADRLVERNLVIVVGEETVVDEHTEELAGMTVEELKEYASEAGIDLKGISKKADIISAIREVM